MTTTSPVAVVMLQPLAPLVQLLVMLVPDFLTIMLTAGLSKVKLVLLINSLRRIVWV